MLKWNVPSPSTVFWTSPGAYTARCENSGGAHVLMVTARNGAQTPTPAPAPAPTPEWGLHLLDANLALGNLLGIVTAETKASPSVTEGGAPPNAAPGSSTPRRER